MGRMGSTTSRRAREMRRVLARWEGSGLSLRAFGERHGIAVSTLAWWRQVFRRAAERGNGARTRGRADTVPGFTELGPMPTGLLGPPGLEIVLRTGELVRVPAGVDPATVEQVLQLLRAPC